MSHERNIIEKSNVLIRQGHQLWHLHKMLIQHPEEEVVPALAQTYMEVGRVKTYSEGVVLAASAINAYRSTESGERVMQVARSRLNSSINETDVNKLVIEV